MKTHILCSVTFYFFENRAVYEIMWQYMVEWDGLQTTIWRMRIACWIPKATNTYSEYVTLIDDDIIRYRRIACWIPKTTNTYSEYVTLIDDDIIWYMRIACSIPKAANTHSEYVTLITCLLQQWLHHKACTLRYTVTVLLVLHIDCTVSVKPGFEGLQHCRLPNKG